ncbi:hypothetical protein C8R44DRAFT_754558, partial [Mycena epipterygia]
KIGRQASPEHLVVIVQYTAYARYLAWIWPLFLKIYRRLVTALPELSILVLETTNDKTVHIQSGQYFTHLAPTAVQFTVSHCSEHITGRSMVVPSGRCIGEGSSVLMMHSRPAASNFDDWKDKFGNHGWSSKDLVPLLQKVKTYEIDPKKPTHGSEGPLKVSLGGDPRRNSLKSVLNMRTGLSVMKKLPKWVSSNGRRSDVTVNELISCILQTVSSPLWNIFSINVRTVKARKFIIVSAGAMGSLILERSETGKKEILEKAGIPLVAELSGVGDNYLETWGQGLLQWEKDGSGMMPSKFSRLRRQAQEPRQPHKTRLLSQLTTSNNSGIDAGIKLRPKADEMTELGPESQEYWNRVLANTPDKPLFSMSPQSGRADIIALRWFYKQIREYVRRMPSFRGIFQSKHPHLSAPVDSDPVLIECPQIVYTAEDDKAIDENLRESRYCLMKPLKKGGVVDHGLNVYGVRNLKVADLSIAPADLHSVPHAVKNIRRQRDLDRIRVINRIQLVAGAIVKPECSEGENRDSMKIPYASGAQRIEVEAALRI